MNNQERKGEKSELWELLTPLLLLNVGTLLLVFLVGWPIYLVFFGGNATVVTLYFIHRRYKRLEAKLQQVLDALQPTQTAQEK